MTPADDDFRKPECRKPIKASSDRHAEGAAIGGDRPKEHISDDKLGYAAFARAIARSIVGIRSDEGIVLAIHGSWGSGKTSAVNMLVEALEEEQDIRSEESKILVVRFNPWWFSEQQDLTRIFFRELSAALGTKVSSDVREKLKAVAKRVSGAKDLVGVLLSPLPGGEFAKKAVGELIGLAGGALDDERSLDEERNELVEALRREGRRILVIIDDVDRLPADEARQIFRLVKSVADLPNIIYLLVFDREIASRAMEAPSGPGGPEWIEKIVQASFDLPPIHPTDLNRLFLEGLQEALGSAKLHNPTRWGNMFYDAIAPWLRTPRDAGRLLNTLSVSWPSIADEANIADFVAIEALRLFQPRLYALIRQSSDQLTGARDHSPRATPEIIGNKILDCVASEQQQKVRQAMERLFPRLEGVWGNTHYTADSLRNWEQERRVCSPKHFATYFTFGVGDDVLPKADLDAALEVIGDSQAFYEMVEKFASQVRRSGGTRSAILLDELEANSEHLEVSRVGDAVSSLLVAGDVFLNPVDEAKGAFSIPVVWKVWFAIQRFLMRMDQGSRLPVLREAVSNSPALCTIGFAVLALGRQHGRHGREDVVTPAEQLLCEEDLNELEQTLAARLAGAASDGSLLANDNAASLMFDWASVSSDRTVHDWTDGLLADDRSTLRLAEVVTQRSISQGLGDRVATQSFSVHRESLERLVDVDRMLLRLDEIAENRATDPKAQEVISHFRSGLNSRF